MSEALESSENKAELRDPSGYEGLVAVEFDPEAAKERAVETKNEQEEKTEEKSEHLAVLKKDVKEKAQKPVEDLSTEEASQEYLDLLMELGSNFTSPEGKLSRVVRADGTVINRGYSGDDALVKKLLKETGEEVDFGDNLAESGLQDFHYNNKYVDRAHNLGMVDGILKQREAWLKAGEDYGEAKEAFEDAEAALQKYTDGEKDMGALKKLFTFGKRRRERKALQEKFDLAQSRKKEIEDSNRFANANMKTMLEAAYSEDYYYGHHSMSTEHNREQGYVDQKNVEYNKQFFSKDRMDKIDRALELRRKLNL